MSNGLNVLELDKILELLSTYSCLEFRKEDFKSLPILYDFNTIQKELNKTEEGIKVINKFGQVSFDYIHNIKDSVSKASKGGILNEEQLYHISTQSKGIEIIKNYYASVKEDDFPIVYKILESLIPLKKLSEDIDRCIGDDLTVLDSASSELRRIRKDIAAKNIELRRRIDTIVKAKAEYLQDSLVTIRNDRYCIPVKAAYKNIVKGIIHDESQTAQSVYIEPEEIVLVNNEISLLKLKIKQLIEEKDEFTLNRAVLGEPTAEHFYNTTGLTGSEYNLQTDPILESKYLYRGVRSRSYTAGDLTTVTSYRKISISATQDTSDIRTVLHVNPLDETIGTSSSSSAGTYIPSYFLYLMLFPLEL